MPTRDNLTLRSLKGSALSFNELDSNFTTLADTIDTLTISTVFNDLVITGNLTMNGVLTSANSSRMEIGDPVIVLNKNSTTPSNDVGLVFQRYSVANTTNYNIGVIWDESTDGLLIGKTSEVGADADVTMTETWMTVANGNVGIGESNPLRKLTIRSDSIGTITALALYNADLTNNNGVVISMRGDTNGVGANTFQEFTAIASKYELHDNATKSSNLEFWNTPSGGVLTNRMTIASNGNVGIGVTPSPWGASGKAVEVGVAGNALWGRTATELHLGQNYYNNSTNQRIYASNNRASDYSQELGAHYWFVSATGTAGNPISFTQAMALDANGNLGLSGSPSTFANGFKAIQIQGASIYANGFNNLNFGTNIAGGVDGAGNGGVYGANDFSARYQQVQGTHRWYTAPSGTASSAITFSQVMILDTSGNLGIGVIPSARLDVAGAIEVNTNVNLNSEATTLATVTKTQVASFPAASFRSAKLIAQAYDAVTGEVQVSELLVAHNGTIASSTEYAVVFTGANPLVVYDVDISGGNVRLMATRTSTNSTQYKVSETLMVA